MTLQPGTVDTVAKTFDIQIANPYNTVMGYEFSVSGLVIESVENLATEHETVPMFNPATGKIIALAANESSIKKNLTPSTFLRIHYASLTDHMVCISEITAVVNSKCQPRRSKLRARHLCGSKRAGPNGFRSLCAAQSHARAHDHLF